jgi:phosphatidylglycerol lysyltransferase
MDSTSNDTADQRRVASGNGGPKDRKGVLARFVDVAGPHVGPLMGAALFLVALWVLHHTLSEFRISDIRRALNGVPTAAVGKAIILTFLNYIVLTGYDWLAMKYVGGKRAPYPRIAAASSVSFAFSNGLGLATIAGSSVRFRLYSAWGLDGMDIAKIIAFCTVTLWIGLAGLTGGLLAIRPLSVLSAPTPVLGVRVIGICLVGLVMLYLLSCALSRKSFSFRSWTFSLPSGSLAVGQIVVSILDWSFAASVLYVLLPTDVPITYVHFLAVFLIAQTAGMASQVPGGLGVTESVVALLLSPQGAAHYVVGSLIVYRLVYYVLPLTVASGALGARELLGHRPKVGRVVGFLGRWTGGLLPWFLTALTFLAGVALLVSGATPAVPERLHWLRHFVPLPILEISHFLSTVIGAALLLLSRAIQSRINAAYFLTAILLSGGVVLSLLKGLDYEESAFLLAILVILIEGRGYFCRKASIFSNAFSTGWIIAIAAVLVGSAWLGFFSHRFTAYSNDAFWSFTFHGDAPRTLRAMIGIAVGLVIFGGARLLSPAKAEPTLPDHRDVEEAAAIAGQSLRTSAYLALLGDKRLLFSNSRKAFVMYGVEGRSWVALGDPVGPAEESREMVWSFREMCDHRGGWPVFYEVGKENLSVFLDVGLTPMKIGEEARVSLPGFVLEGGDRKTLRQTIHRIEREEGVFRIVPASDVPPLLPELRTVSDVWLKTKRTREKGFSLGYFAEAYIRQFPVATLTIGGKVVAFANVLLGAEKDELSVDLMRYYPNSPNGVMEYLFTKLMVWGRDSGYHWFNLGMVPLAGLEDRSLAPLWNRLGARVYRHGEHFYNFQGLRHYKERFGPVWEPRYLVLPGGLHLPHILTNVASLISGGLKGVIAK